MKVAISDFTSHKVTNSIFTERQREMGKEQIVTLNGPPSAIILSLLICSKPYSIST